MHTLIIETRGHDITPYVPPQNSMKNMHELHQT
jgi:hypothetical protein